MTKPQPEPTIWTAINAIADRLAALEAAATPPPAPDHIAGVAEMVATDEELQDLWDKAPGGIADGFRAVYNRGLQHGEYNLWRQHGSQWAEMLRKEADR